MNTVIGLFHSDQQVETSVARLKQGGFGEDQIRVFTCKDEVCQYLNKYCPYHLVGVWTFFGLFTGMVLLGVFGLVISLVNFLVLGFSIALWGDVFLVLALLGAVFGALVGYIFGKEQWQRETQLYLQGARAEDKVVAVRVTNGETASKAELLLQHDNARGIERLSHVPEAVFEHLANKSQPNSTAPSYS